MATHSSILAWKTPWTEEPGGLQSMGSPGMVIGHLDTTEHTYTQRLIRTEELDWKYKIKYILFYEI